MLKYSSKDCFQSPLNVKPSVLIVVQRVAINTTFCDKILYTLPTAERINLIALFTLSYGCLFIVS